MAVVTLEHVGKRYGDISVIEDLNLQVGDREFLVLVGPSGCGKSTALRMVAGLEDVSTGTIAIDGRPVNRVAPKDRDVAMVFQNYALYPHMTVRENLEFGLRMRKTPAPERERLVAEAAEILEIGPLLERRPRQLSGGQRQRVALGRAIVRKPAVFLFDEPLSNLDAKLRVQMRAEIKKLQLRLGTTTIYVTHDQVEAMTMGSRIAVMRSGRIQQIGAPLEIYRKPANLFVAQFIGAPPMNFLSGRVEERAEAVVTDSFFLPLPQSVRAALAGGGGRRVVVGIRPENVHPAEAVSPGDRTAAVLEVENVEPLGDEVVVHGRVGTDSIICKLGPQRVPLVGERLPIAFDLDRLHFFDPETELSLAA
jgi:multiple sugar transport system ATP-binding protein